MSVGGFSPGRIARLRQVLEDYVRRRYIPGAVGIVSRHGEVHAEAVGVRTFGDETPMHRDSIFRISSMTKPVIAAATMTLVEEGSLRLDDSVETLLPELRDRRVLKTLASPLDDTVPADRAITVRDLLTFRMGLGIVTAPADTYPIQTAMAALRLGQDLPHPEGVPSPDEWLRRLGTLPLMYQPGERWTYNTGSDVLGVLIARASGRSLENFLRERIFDPLGMKDTGFSVPASKLERLVTAYSAFPPRGVLEVYDPPKGGQWSRPPDFPSGAGGLVSTADDYLAFGEMLLGRGVHRGRRVLSRPSVELMTTDQLTPNQKEFGGLVPGAFENDGWGFGVSVTTRRAHTYAPVGSYWWGGGMGTGWRSDPQEGMVTVLMTQRLWDSPHTPKIVRDFWTAAYAAIDD
jgi:CubicO group peptidase (beta-lactamase class C family)